MKKINENTKITLTIKQLKSLVQEAKKQRVAEATTRAKVTKVIRATDKVTGEFKLCYQGETSDGETIRWKGEYTGNPRDMLRVGSTEMVYGSEIMSDSDIAEFDATTTPGWDMNDRPKSDTIMVGRRNDTVQTYNRKDLEDELAELQSALARDEMPLEPRMDYVGISDPEGRRDVDVVNALANKRLNPRQRDRIEKRMDRIQRLLAMETRAKRRR